MTDIEITKHLLTLDSTSKDKQIALSAEKKDATPFTEEETTELIQMDFRYTRDKLKALVDIGESAIESFREVAEETQEPRAYEVLATLLKNTGDLAKTLMDNAKVKTSIDKDRKALSVTTTDTQPTPVTNKQTNIFVGTTKDLLEKLKIQEIDDIEHEQFNTDTRE